MRSVLITKISLLSEAKCTMQSLASRFQVKFIHVLRSADVMVDTLAMQEIDRSIPWEMFL